MTAPEYWQTAIEYLATRDRVMANLIATYPQEMMINYHNPFGTLLRAIVGQQISVKAANKICDRLESLLGSFSPDLYLIATENDLRECGLSRPKIRYITNIARALEDGTLTPLNWSAMSDREVAQQLMSIPGIGPWTAEMFLIFHLHRADILPLGDIGLIRAIEVHYAAGNRLNKAEIETISQHWKPYRTVATWYLWRSLDPMPVQY
jgi:DNA-3-methyladenine glycosylase II